MKIGIICGHQINDLFDSSEEICVDTGFGRVNLTASTINGHQVFFLNRHGNKSNIPPHKIKYKSHIEALSCAHVDCVIAIGTVGSMNNQIEPGDFVVPHDFFDATRARSQSFFDEKRVHVDMTQPFCPNLRKTLIGVCKANPHVTIHGNGVYVTTEGPRLESVSEIHFYATIGELVGMTLVPEVVLAREKGLCFASLCLVCNMAAGMQDKLSVNEIKQVFSEKEQYLGEIIKETIAQISIGSDCDCKHKLRDALL